jgi:alkanesulfonate monooxygenase SsuD/methylene tetrahydromethanopterin reductase-like flavin-dependent oxidoreductase (luciferase family)
MSAVPISIGASFPESVMPGTPLPDSALSLAAAAAVTSSITVGYTIYVPSLRPLAWAAMQVATLQHIAGGRLQLGVAIGAGSDAEYLAAGFRRQDRASRTDEFLTRLPAILVGQPLPDGPGTPGPDAIRPLPAVPVPPLWVGGTSVPAPSSPPTPKPART